MKMDMRHQLKLRAQNYVIGVQQHFSMCELMILQLSYGARLANLTSYTSS